MFLNALFLGHKIQVPTRIIVPKLTNYNFEFMRFSNSILYPSLTFNVTAQRKKLQKKQKLLQLKSTTTISNGVTLVLFGVGVV